MKKNYRFAGIDICLDIPDSCMYENEYRLADFISGKSAAPYLYKFSFVESLDAPDGELLVNAGGYRIYGSHPNFVQYKGPVQESWKNAYIRIAYRGLLRYVQVLRSSITERIGTHTVLNILGIEHLIAQAGGFVFHCSYIVYRDGAILFTAPSESGKSTQAELWRRYRGAEIINGDRAAICIRQGSVSAEGIPFSGSSEYCINRSYPVRAIVYLAQAPQTTIRPVTGYEAFSKIWQGITLEHWRKEDVERVSGTAQIVASSVPIFYLACTPDESAVIALEQAMESRCIL